MLNTCYFGILSVFLNKNDDAASFQARRGKLLAQWEVGKGGSETQRVRFFNQKKNMDTKLTLDPNVILEAYKAVGDNDMFTQLMVAAAYYTKYRGKLPKKFTKEDYPIAFDYFTNHIEPALTGKPAPTCNVGPELFAFIDRSYYFDEVERKVLKDMLTMWWGRGNYARTELIYTQSMAQNRCGCGAEKFIELRKWLRANEALDWENRPYNDYITSYHTFNEQKLLEVLKAEDKSLDI